MERSSSHLLKPVVVLLALAYPTMPVSTAHSRPDPEPNGVRANHQSKFFRIRGSVVDASGIPLRDGAVTYFLKPPTGSGMCGTGLPAAPIREGLFELAVHAPGAYGFWVRPGLAGGFGVSSHPATIAISSDTTVAITADGYRVEGVVVGSDGKALDGAIVFARGRADWSNKSDANGRYSLILSEGRYRLATIYPWGQVHRCEPESLSILGPARVNIRMKGPPFSPSDSSSIHRLKE
jgi:hypothetical protein